VDATLAPFDAEFLVRGPVKEQGSEMSGSAELPFALLVVIQFPDMDKAMAWHESDEYKAIVGARDELCKNAGVFMPAAKTPPWAK
jgi:uncharacterized protein (DUF1330 family)